MWKTPPPFAALCDSWDMSGFFIHRAQTLAELNYYRNSRFYLEFPNRCFVPKNLTGTPGFRAHAVNALVHSGDIAILDTALWIHTGIYRISLARSLPVARSDAKYRGSATRRIIPAHFLCTYENLKVSGPELTAIDFLRSDLCTGVSLLPRITESGTSLRKILHTAQKMPRIPHIRTIRQILIQLIYNMEPTLPPVRSENTAVNEK